MLSKILKQKRLDLGYSQEQLAMMLSVQQHRISKWENGSTPDAHNLIKLMLSLDITPDELKEITHEC